MFLALFVAYTHTNTHTAIPPLFHASVPANATNIFVLRLQTIGFNTGVHSWYYNADGTKKKSCSCNQIALSSFRRSHNCHWITLRLWNLCGSLPLTRLSLVKRRIGHGIFSIHNNLSTCCVPEGDKGSNQSAHRLGRTEKVPQPPRPWVQPMVDVYERGNEVLGTHMQDKFCIILHWMCEHKTGILTACLSSDIPWAELTPFLGGTVSTFGYRALCSHVDWWKNVSVECLVMLLLLITHT